MLASSITFTVMTMLIKFLGEDYSPSLQTFYRQLAGLIVLLPVILPNPREVFRTTRMGILLFRSGAGTVGMILAFYAYQKLPLADANALSFTRTLWVVPLAAFAAERICRAATRGCDDSRIPGRAADVAAADAR
jgi:drug/metabolite transporter (DMT)-like permease